MYSAIQCVPSRSSGSVFPNHAEGTFNLLGSLFLVYTPLKTLLVLGCVFSTWSISMVFRCAGISMGDVTRTLRHPREATVIVKAFVHRLINNA
jgi:hypothetical protein